MLYYTKPMRKNSSLMALFKESRGWCDRGKSSVVNGLSRADRWWRWCKWLTGSSQVDSDGCSRYHGQAYVCMRRGCSFLSFIRVAPRIMFIRPEYLRILGLFIVLEVEFMKFILDRRWRFSDKYRI